LNLIAGTRPRCRGVRRAGTWGGPSGAYWVDLKVPWLTRCVEVNYDLLVGQTELFDCNMGTVSPRAAVVCVEGDFGGVAVGSCHFVAGWLAGRGIRVQNKQ
jgi:hypothetical protein